MREWIAAIAAGVLLGALSYIGRGTASAGARGGLALLRGTAVALLVALALDAPAGRARRASMLVALDVSQSWTRGGDSAAFAAARDSARSLASDTVWLVGDSLRPRAGDVNARDVASRVGALVDRAAAAGRAMVLLTDGEIDDATTLRALPRGSRISSLRPARGADVAAVSIDAPRLATATDTITVRVGLSADASGAPAGVLLVDAGGRGRAELAVDALPAFGERTVSVPVSLAGLAGPAVLRAVITAAGDREPRNDTLATTIDVTSAPAAVFVSTAPDYDGRDMLAVLRGALALPTRAYLRIAPGLWRVEGTLAPIDESAVRQAAAAAGVLVLHGDTAAFGPTRGAGRGALLLFPSTSAAATSAEGGEWYASEAPASPAAAALSGVPWDSLPPLDITGAPPAGDWDVLRARLSRSGAPRPLIAGRESPRRVIVVGASGFWRWQFRGGVAADAFAALWGGLFDFLAAGRGDARAAVAADAVVRAGESVRWRRGGSDSIVTVVLTRRGGSATPDTARLRFTSAGEPVASRGLAAGVYDMVAPGGASVLVVNAARELLPRRPTVQPGPVGTASVADATPRIRDFGWLYAVALGLLCGEWLLRRRQGLR